MTPGLGACSALTGARAFGEVSGLGFWGFGFRVLYAFTRVPERYIAVPRV